MHLNLGGVRFGTCFQEEWPEDFGAQCGKVPSHVPEVHGWC